MNADSRIVIPIFSFRGEESLPSAAHAWVGMLRLRNEACCARLIAPLSMTDGLVLFSERVEVLF
jgi:hypothetical protein